MRAAIIAVAMGVSICVSGLVRADQTPEGMRQETHIVAQDLGAALRSLAKERGFQVLVSSELVRNVRTTGAQGALTMDEALEKLLGGTGLTYQYLDERTVTIQKVGNATAAQVGERGVRMAQMDAKGAGAGRASGSEASAGEEGQDSANDDSATVDNGNEGEYLERGGIPEILVTGSTIKSLNMDIRRTQNDAQPYVVFDRKVIERSGATNLEEFFKNQLTMSVNMTSPSQAASTTGNTSSISLRGLGSDETLILIDGHRTAGTSSTGLVFQPDLNGIPLSAIERIEVLPATASGLYGGGATGGAINIILRRDYAGLDTRVAYGNSFASDVTDRRIDLSAGFNLSGGRTGILVASSYAESNPLLVEERDFVQRGRQHILRNDPNYFSSRIFPPIGSTPNIRSFNEDNLVLKDGTPLNSPITSIPNGYAGVSVDGGAALVANAGRYNLNLADTAQTAGGGRQALLNSPTVESYMVTVRHEWTPRLRSFADIRYAENSGRFQTNTANTFAVLPPSALNNPFQQSIRISAPTVGADGVLVSRTSNQRVVSGLVFDLSKSWTAELDLTWNRSESDYTVPGGLTSSVETRISSGELDVLRDLNVFPVQLTPYAQPSIASGGEVTLRSAAVRVGGTLPWLLSAGAPLVTMLLEQREEQYGDALLSNNSGQFLWPSQSQSVKSIYMEARLPILASRDRALSAPMLEAQIAVRGDDYKITGSPAAINLASPVPIAKRTNEQASMDPTLALRYQPIADLALRGSVGTGYLPPAVSQLVPRNPLPLPLSHLRDPLRDGEALGVVDVTFGGNPDLRAEESESWSIGAILTPRLVPGLRTSIDWVRIDKSDNIATLFGTSQSGLNDFMTFAPDRITRAPPPEGESIGRIVEIDSSLINISRLSVEAVDVALDYRFDAGSWGHVDLATGATNVISLESQITSVAPTVQNAGVANTLSNEGGGLKWKANSSVTWSYRDFVVGWGVQFFGAYYINTDHSFVTIQGSNRIPSQTYHRVFGTYRLSAEPGFIFSGLVGAEIQFGVNNILGKNPPIDVASNIANAYYSNWGDPRLTTYYISIRKNFDL